MVHETIRSEALYIYIAVDEGKIFSRMQGWRSISPRREATRLPRIAPKSGSSPQSPRTQPPIPAPRTYLQSTPRTRVPPRSRSGCWTCRRRKVKCDEQKPTCGQCARLGHECDYKPRLIFKDDNRTAMKRAQDVTTIGSSVWNPRLPTPEYRTQHFGPDLLPAFSTLINDEDRERKAEMMKPGTYLVIANLSSFANLPEYRETDIPTSQTNIQPTMMKLKDPNSIILETFEDPPRRSPVSPRTKPDLLSAPSPARLSTSFERPVESGQLSGHSSGSSITELDRPQSGGGDAHLLAHYRSNISQRVIKVGSQEVEEDAFEVQARTFPPLFHAMMAISALSLAHRAGTQSTEALELYHQVLPAMRRFVQNTEDSNSDGALFTHYLLLLYEVASSGPGESDMLQFHSRTLLEMVTRRRQVNRTEPHGFLVLVICLADMYALLSGSGNGAFVEYILKNNMLAPQDYLPSLAPGCPQPFFEEELHYFPGVLELNQQVIILATTVGRTARDMRRQHDERRRVAPATADDEYAYNASRKSRASEIQALCRTSVSKWEIRYPQYWSRQPAPKILPSRVRGFWDHTYTLYRACVIYSHTSMYPGQMAELASDNVAGDEVFTSVTEIIDLARQVVADERWELQYLPFAIFLSGVASRRNDEKELALKLMTALEQQSLGGNTATIRRLLVTIYEKQQAATRSGGQDLAVDWVEVMKMSGLRLVMFGM